MKVIIVVGARPNFMKVAPLVDEMKRRKSEFAPLLVHTGQHYDEQMSDAFFRDLSMPAPNVYLGVGSGSHAVQTAAVMTGFEPIVLREKPDTVVVVGDVNSTLACALVCAKTGTSVAHVEAGLRSRDRTMPEEINRIVTDQISDLLLTTSVDANSNLLAEGIPPERIRLVGNIMIDSLLSGIERAKDSGVRRQFGIEGRDYAVVTLHRPSNVDVREIFFGIIDALSGISEMMPVVFPVHPRTREQIRLFGLSEKIESAPGLILTDPLGYLDFIHLFAGARIVLTDSGGIQEETTALAIPCLTLRENTERPITVELGTNHIVGTDPQRILNTARDVIEMPESVRKEPPPLWDGKTAGRIADALLEFNH